MNDHTPDPRTTESTDEPRRPILGWADILEQLRSINAVRPVTPGNSHVE